MSDAPWTIGRLLTWTTDYLKQHGAESPRLDAEVLLAYARGCPRIQLYANFDEVAADELRTRFRELVKQRAEGMPVAYLVGKREFFSLDFKVTPDVLIPRPETEHVVLTLLDLLKEQGGAAEITDMCTGSGCIAVSVAKHAPKVRVTAVDISSAALAIAAQNAVSHGVDDRVEFVESDLFAKVLAGKKFDFIAANPPYITSAEYAQLPRTVKDFEPRFALEAGEQGLDVVKRLIPQAAERLKPQGALLMEISPMIRQPVCDLVDSTGLFEACQIIKDLAGLARVVVAKRKS
jgi:release factor glutamine methyltransferase